MPGTRSCPVPPKPVKSIVEAVKRLETEENVQEQSESPSAMTVSVTIILIRLAVTLGTVKDNANAFVDGLDVVVRAGGPDFESTVPVLKLELSSSVTEVDLSDGRSGGTVDVRVSRLSNVRL